MTAACIGAASLSSLCKLLKISLTFPLTISQKDEGTRDLLRVNLCSANDNLCNLCITFFVRTFLFNTGITVSLTGTRILQLSMHSSWGTKNIPRVGGCWGWMLCSGTETGWIRIVPYETKRILCFRIKRTIFCLKLPHIQPIPVKSHIFCFIGIWTYILSLLSALSCIHLNGRSTVCSS